MFPSKENVSCFYCEWTGRKDKLVSHSNKHHPGAKVQIGIAPNALSNFWKQNSLPPPTNDVEKSTNVNEGNEDSPTFDQTQSTTMPAHATPVVRSSHTTPVTTPTMPSPCLFSPSNDFQLQQPLSFMSEQLLKLNTKFDSLLVTKTSVSVAQEVNEAEDFDAVFNELKSSDDLYKMKNFEINAQMELMTCLPCSKHKLHAPKQLQSMIKSSFGVFKFIEQDREYNQTQKFRDLKKSVRSHLSNNLHVWCTREEQKKNKRRKKRLTL